MTNAEPALCQLKDECLTCAVKVVHLCDDVEWNRYVLGATQYDFYHCHSYQQLDPSGESVLFVVEDSTTGSYIAMPVLIRRIPGTDRVDCSSVYGYPGPITNLPHQGLNAVLAARFRNELLIWLKSIGAVSFVTRMNPLIDMDAVTCGLGDVIQLNDTVAIDLKLSPDEQLKQYRDSIYGKVKQIRKKGLFEVRLATSEQEIDEFIDTYNETMLRVKANDYYFFPRDYFYGMFNAPDYKTHLLLAFSNGEMAAGIILPVAKDIMQAHLVATKDKFMKDAPMKLLFDEARILGNSLGLSYLHLGGGYGGQVNDSLFFFKSSFSQLTFKYKMWTLIVDREKYDKLVKENSAQRLLRENYFPQYRG